MKNFIKKYCTYGNVLLLLLCMLVTMYPFCYMPNALVLDTAVQIKTGLLMLNGQSISGDIYSWHEGLNWITHEKYWYLLVGLIYKYFQVPGLVVFNSFFNLILLLFITFVNKICFKYNTGVLTLSLVLCVSMLGLLNVDIRPQVISIPITVSLAIVLSFLNNKNLIYYCFVLAVIMVSLFHCSTAMILFIIYGFRIIIDLIFDRNIKSFIVSVLISIVGFIITLIGSGGFESWLYLSKQSCYPEIMEVFSAWDKGVFEVKEAVLLLMVLIGLVLGFARTEFKKDSVLSVGYFCMFFIATIIYLRMILYLVFITYFFVPKAIKAFDELIFRNCKFVNSFCKKIYDLGKRSALVLICVFICIVVLSNYTFYDISIIRTINDAAEVNSYDNELLDFIKKKGYSKVYNNFDIGTWLLFNDIKVNVDNRVDPYLASYSGEDNFHNSYAIDNLVNLNDFVDKYSPDAIILYYNKNADTLYTNNGTESYSHSDIMCNFISMIDTYESNSYRKVYENTVAGLNQYSFNGERTYNGVELTWVIYEPIYE